jgi:ABC-type lipoprotein export system ATPase subunit
VSAILTLKGATRAYRFADRDVLALDEVALTLPRGGLVALTGPSGSGKTTLLHTLAGFDTLDRGHLTWHHPVTDPGRWEQVAFLPQRLGLLDELDLSGNILWPARLAGSAATHPPADLDELADHLDLTDVLARRPHEASLGQQQRAALARALLLSPLVLLADEPTGHQDGEATRRVLTSLRRACDTGTTAIVATHDPRIAEHADQVVHLSAGRVVEPMPPSRPDAAAEQR